MEKKKKNSRKERILHLGKMINSDIWQLNLNSNKHFFAFTFRLFDFANLEI